MWSLSYPWRRHRAARTFVPDVREWQKKSTATAATREWTATVAANWQKKRKLEERKRGRGTSTPDTSAGERLRDLTRDTARAKRPRAAAVGEVTSDDVAECIQREWAAARALDAERDATTGRGVDGRAREAVGRRDAGGAGTKRPAATDDGRADENGPGPKKKKARRKAGQRAGRTTGPCNERASEERAITVQ